MLKKTSLAAAVLWLGSILYWTAGAGVVAANTRPAGDRAKASVPAPVMAVYGKLPLSFVENQGQVDSPARFYTLGPGLQAGFSPGEITLGFPAGKKSRALQAARRPAERYKAGAPSPPQPYRLVRLRPLNLSPAVRLTGADQVPGKFNHYKGSDPGRWRSGIPVYGAVFYRQAYPGVDLRFYGQGQSLEYDVIVHPGANPSQVRFRLEGIKGLALTPTGDLAVSLPGGGQFLQKKPLIYQEEAGGRAAREGTFKLYRKGRTCEYGFEVAAYDRTRPLIIDPTFVYSTYWGGSEADTAMDVVTDASGNAFVVGYTNSSNFLTYPGATFQGVTDVFALKLNPTGKVMVWSTLLGGASTDEGYAVDLDQNGNPCICGETFSDDFPHPNGFQATRKGSGDAFVARLNGLTGALLYGTYLGGRYEDKASDIKADPVSGNIWVVGSTKSDDFYKINELCGYRGAWDVFVAKINAGGDLIYSTYLGGSNNDYGKAIALDKYGNAYLTGDTSSTDFLPKENAVRDYSGNGDVFVTKIYSLGTAAPFSTYLGGTNSDYGVDIAVQSDLDILVTGQTNSPDFPQERSIHPYKGSYDVFLTCLTPPRDYGSTWYIFFSTLLGGTGLDFGNGIALDTRENIYLIGTTYSNDFHLEHPWYAYGGGELQGTTDAFVAKFNLAGYLSYSTYLGGSGNESGFGIALDSANNLFLTGTTTSGADFPTKNPLISYGGGGDLFITKVGVEIQGNLPFVQLLLLLND